MRLEGAVEIVLPVECLPWRELRWVNETKACREGYGVACSDDPLRLIDRVLKPAEAEARLGVFGVTKVRLRAGLATLTGVSGRPIRIAEIRVANGTKMPAVLRAKPPKTGSRPGILPVRQLSGGRPIGGISLELWKRLPRRKRFSAKLIEGRLVVSGR